MRTGSRGTVTESKDLSEGNGLLSAFSEESGANIEVARVQEGEDVCCNDTLVRAAISQFTQLTGQIAPCEISCRKILWDDCGVPAVDNVTNLSGGNLLPDIRGREVDTNSTESRLDDRDQSLTEPSNIGLGA